MNTTSSVSLLRQVRSLQGQHLHLNVIRVGFDAIAAADRDEAAEKLDYAIYRVRTIYHQASLGVGRVEHYAISTADANGRDDIGSEDEADQLSDEWSVPNDGIDVFVVRVITDPDFVGISPVPGSCDKDSNNDGLLGGEINRHNVRTRDFDFVARTFAHEVGHFLDLKHNHGAGNDCSSCPTTQAACDNLMAQTRCAICCGTGERNAVALTSDQGSTMRRHCSVRTGC